MNSSFNHLVFSASIDEFDALRYTPAGLPALNLKLTHESSVKEGDTDRQVKAAIKAIAFGVIAESLVKQLVGSSWKFTGFLATPRNGKHVVLHIQEFQQD